MNENETRIRTIIEPHMPASPTRDYIVNKILTIPRHENAIHAAEWVADLSQGKRRIQPTTVLNRVNAVGAYLAAAGDRELESLDDVYFNEFFTDRTTLQDGQNARRILSNQVAYEHQRHVLHFLQNRMGDDEGFRRAPIMANKLAWGTNRALGCSWNDIAKLRAIADLEGKAQIDILSATGTNCTELRVAPFAGLFFVDGRAFLRLPPTKNWPDERIVPIHHEAKTIGAFVRHVLANEPDRKYIFPDPNDPTRPMTRGHLRYKVSWWCKRAKVRGINTRTLQEAYLLYLASRRVPDQFISHVMGVGKMNRVYFLRDYVDRARLAGRTISGPVHLQVAVHAGLVACAGCGNPNNAAGDQYCPICGTELTEDVLSEANAVRAKIMRDVADLLDVTGTSLEQRVRAAIAAVRKEGQHAIAN